MLPAGKRFRSPSERSRGPKSSKTLAPLGWMLEVDEGRGWGGCSIALLMKRNKSSTRLQVVRSDLGNVGATERKPTFQEKIELLWVLGRFFLNTVKEKAGYVFSKSGGNDMMGFDVGLNLKNNQKFVVRLFPDHVDMSFWIFDDDGTALAELSLPIKFPTDGSQIVTETSNEDALRLFDAVRSMRAAPLFAEVNFVDFVHEEVGGPVGFRLCGEEAPGEPIIQDLCSLRICKKLY